jgi:hypothetical protein
MGGPRGREPGSGDSRALAEPTLPHLIWEQPQIPDHGIPGRATEQGTVTEPFSCLIKATFLA